MNVFNLFSKAQGLTLNILGTSGCIAIIFGFAHLSIQPIQEAKYTLMTQRQEAIESHASIPFQEQRIADLHEQLQGLDDKLLALKELRQVSAGKYQLMLKEYGKIIEQSNVELIQFNPIEGTSSSKGVFAFEMEVQGSYGEVCEFTFLLETVGQLQRIDNLHLQPSRSGSQLFSLQLRVSVLDLPLKSQA